MPCLIDFLVVPNILEQSAVVGQKRKHNSCVVIQGETPLLAQFSGELVSSKPRIVRVCYEDFDSSPEPLFQLGPSFNPFLEGAFE